MPTSSRLLPVSSDEMKRKFAANGVTENVAVIKSNGGEMTLEAAASSPINMTVSGPTGGVVAGKYIAKLLGIGSLVTIDMGGTSTDCSTIVGGQESFTTGFEIEWGLPIQIPMIDIRTIGAGGGSIAWIDKGGMLRVGPQSAGAAPGPACYGENGTEATVTDANLVLGRLNPAYFLGGTMSLDAEAANAAVERVATRLAKTPEETAMAIVRIANTNMVGALRSVLIERGLDPRDFTLMPFGGAGPLHACDLIEEMGIPRAVVPNHPGQFSAYGFILTDARVDRHRTLQLTSKRFDRERASQVLQTLVDEAVGEVKAQGYVDNIEIFRSLEMRYLGQNYELELPIAFDAFSPQSTAALWEQFHAAHLSRFGFDIPGEVIEIVNFSATVVSVTPKPVFREIERGSGEPRSRRKADSRLRRWPPRIASLPARRAARRRPDRWSRDYRGGRLRHGSQPGSRPRRRPLRQSRDQPRLMTAPASSSGSPAMDLVTMNILEFNDGVDLPRDGHHADEDLVLDDLQRGA